MGHVNLANCKDVKAAFEKLRKHYGKIYHHYSVVVRIKPGWSICCNDTMEECYRNFARMENHHTLNKFKK